MIEVFLNCHGWLGFGGGDRPAKKFIPIQLQFFFWGGEQKIDQNIWRPFLLFRPQDDHFSLCSAVSVTYNDLFFAFSSAKTVIFTLCIVTLWNNVCNFVIFFLGGGIGDLVPYLKFGGDHPTRSPLYPTSALPSDYVVKFADYNY